MKRLFTVHTESDFPGFAWRQFLSLPLPPSLSPGSIGPECCAKLSRSSFVNAKILFGFCRHLLLFFPPLVVVLVVVVIGSSDAFAACHVFSLFLFYLLSSASYMSSVRASFRFGFESLLAVVAALLCKLLFFASITFCLPVSLRPVNKVLDTFTSFAQISPDMTLTLLSVREFFPFFSFCISFLFLS